MPYSRYIIIHSFLRLNITLWKYLNNDIIQNFGTLSLKSELSEEFTNKFVAKWKAMDGTTATLDDFEDSNFL